MLFSAMSVKNLQFPDQEAPAAADERLEERPVAGRRSRMGALHQERVWRTAYYPGGAVRVSRRRRRGRRGAWRTSRVDRRGGCNDGLDDPGDPQPDDGMRRCACRTRARGRPADLRLRVDEDDG